VRSHFAAKARSSIASRPVSLLIGRLSFCTIFMPLSCGGLWLAVIMTPPSKP
jgi:hypothetical protein